MDGYPTYQDFASIVVARTPIKEKMNHIEV